MNGINKKWRWWNVPRTLLKWSATVFLGIVVFVISALIFLIFTPSFSLSSGQTTWLLERVLPRGFVIEGLSHEVRLERGRLGWLSKRLVVASDGLCVRTRGLDACADRMRLALSFAWRAFRPFPELTEIEPLELLRARMNGDLAQMAPATHSPKENSESSLLQFVMGQVLPKWRYNGSRVEIEKLRLENLGGGDLDLSLKFVTFDSRARLDMHRLSFRDRNPRSSRDLEATARVDFKRQAQGLELESRGRLAIGRERSMALDGRAVIHGTESLDFDLDTRWRGLVGLERVRVRGDWRGARLSAMLSIQVGAAGGWVRSLDFVDCAFNADLDLKSGSLSCGPESVTLRLVERGFWQDPKMFTFTPAFELRADRIQFGATKAVDLKFHLSVQHGEILRAELSAEGSLKKANAEPAEIDLQAKMNAAALEFRRVVELLRRTPYAVPAPLNVLSGGLGAEAELRWTRAISQLKFSASTDLSSRHQKAKLTLDGETRFEAVPTGYRPDTNVTISIEDLRLSAPRFDLRAPPRLRLDGRFGKVADLANPTAQPSENAPPFRLRIRTLRPDAIHIATSLTKGAIPIGMDLVYDSDRERMTAARGELGPRSEPALKARTRDKPRPAPVTGWVLVGRTPIEIFRRRAALEELRLDFLDSGEQRMAAHVGVSYLDYDIEIFANGDVASPQLRFASQPPLESDQILSVLLFGRPLNELEDDERSSVGDLNAAFANAALGVSSLYFLASTPFESVGYDPDRQLVTAQLGLGGGASIEVGGGSDASAIGFKKRLSREFVFRSDVERLGATGRRTVSALVEWVKRF